MFKKKINWEENSAEKILEGLKEIKNNKEYWEISLIYYTQTPFGDVLSERRAQIKKPEIEKYVSGLEKNFKYIRRDSKEIILSNEGRINLIYPAGINGESLRIRKPRNKISDTLSKIRHSLNYWYSFSKADIKELYECLS